jgi:hypothetical protein
MISVQTANKSKYQTNPNPNTKVTKPNKSHNHKYQSIGANKSNKGTDELTNRNKIDAAKLMHRVATV